jgi:Phage integrase family
MGSHHVSGELADYKAQCNPDGLVFPSVTGTPLRNRNWRRDVFDSAVEALGLKITPHNLRDTTAPLAIQAGASVVAVARLLGHESAATTLNHYAGLFPTDLHDIASRLNAAARLTIASQRASSDAKFTDQAPTRRSQDQQVNTCKPSLTCENPSAPGKSAPGRNRTGDLGIRRPLLYPTELRRQCAGQSIQR